MAEVSEAAREVLEEDLALIRELLADFSNYDFSADLRGQMERAGLSANALAERIDVSHTAVGKWIGGDARPQGKERMKTLGMALGQTEEELNAFLLTNGYPHLNAKNPLDDACRLILRTHRGRADIASRYLELIEQHRLNSWQLQFSRSERPTYDISRSFEAVDSPEAFAEWINRNSRYFGASARSVIANAQLLRRIWLYIGDSTVNDLYMIGELPLPIRNLLYALLGSHEVATKGLRNKLILFGLYENMTEEELNLLLEDAKLRSLSDPKTKLDQALLTAVRSAHDHYPYYEYETNMILSEHLRSGLFLSKTEEQAARIAAMLEPFAQRLKIVEANTGYYESHKARWEEQFEELYTSRSDRGLMHYVYDVLSVLRGEQAVEPAETQEFLALYDEQEQLPAD